MDTATAIALIAETMAAAEEGAATTRDAMRDLKEAFEQLATEENVSTLETLAFATELDALATGFQAALFDVHSRMTQRATALGLESMLPAMRGGGGR